MKDKTKLMAEETGFRKKTTPMAERSISSEKIQKRTSCMGVLSRAF
jgi:hypothetical protein